MVERDPACLLAGLSVPVRPGRFAFVSRPQPDARLAAHAPTVVREDEGVGDVVDASEFDTGLDADAAAPALRAARTKFAAQPAFDAVGSTAAVSTALADAGLACNVIAGAHHDDLPVDAARRDDVLAALATLRQRHGGA